MGLCDFSESFCIAFSVFQRCIQDELQGVLKDIGLAFDDGSVQGMLQRTDSTLLGFHLLYIGGDDDGSGDAGSSCLPGKIELKGEANCSNS